MIQTILAGRKSATCCPAYDLEDSALRPGDDLRLLDKHGNARGQLLVTAVEVRSFGEFDDALAEKEGVTLAELKEKMNFANGRKLRENEEMRVVHFRLVRAVAGKP